jgi:nitrogen-specific signal transduction histidine kinase/ActR/RegA family two-component response regulator
VGVQTDVTQRRQLEAELRQAQKMEAVGQFAAGVAHDFNNLLSVVMSYSELMLAELEPASTLREDLEEIRRAGERATGLARQLLTFSRQQVLQPRVLELGALVEGMQKMLRRLLGEDIALEVLPSASAHTVHADPTGLEQVLMNLVVNARDAMPHGGTLTIGLENMELGALEHPLASGGPYVLLTVTDTGDGMDSATREHIFEPFFSTKEKGKGTGLGLSTVFGIVRQSNGFLTVQSEKGHGASFKVFLPHVQGVDDTVRGPGPSRSTLHGTEAILVAEDDEQVRSVTCAILQRAGYSVVGAHNAGEAFLLCEENPARFDLLVADLLMPHLNGPQLAARLQKLQPQLQVLFMSGYAQAALEERGAQVPPGAVVLAKPILPEPLLRAVRSALDARALLPG